MENKISDWIISVVDGFIQIEHAIINSFKFDYILISRRDSSRTGARYHTRGADTKGNVANFVETEQIVVYDMKVSSWVETRGSIPLLWMQTSKHLKPRPKLVSSPFMVCFLFCFIFLFILSVKF